MLTVWISVSLAGQLLTTQAIAAEVCRYAGSGDYHAQIGITSIARPAERRPDLDLPPDETPGNKKQRRAAPDPSQAGAHVWRVRLDSEPLGIIPGRWPA